MRTMFQRMRYPALAVGLALAAPSLAWAADEPPVPAALDDVNTLWTCLAAFLVFFMQAGFALVETGLTRAKNACNICMKNLMDFAIGSVAFWMVGFGLMFGMNASGWIGTTNFFYDAETNSFNWAFFMFQTVFCATAATIISGAVAERTKFTAYLCYSVALTALIYPISGSWCWNGLMLVEGSKGWLEKLGFMDFAGSTVVHSVGGWAALAGAICVGARKGKYVKGKPVAIPGHNLPLVTLGVFILWLGWFGFNPGSTTAIGGGSFAYIAMTTNISAAMGALAGMFTSWIVFKKPDISFTLNGTLAGLVAITAGCNAVSVPSAMIIGGIAGLLVVFACLFFDRIGVDDPVGAISVHGVCGAFGTLATGFFARDIGLFASGKWDQVLTQLTGVGAIFAWAFGSSMVIFLLLKFTIGLRVSEVEEMEGLDIHEHGIYAYPPAMIYDSPVGVPMGSPAAMSSAPAPAMMAAAE